MSKGPARCRRSDSKISMTATIAAVLAALILLCTGCGESAFSLFSPARAGRTVRVVIEDNPQMRVESSVLTVKEGSDLQFTITPAQHCTVRGTDYRDYSLDPAQDGQYICTLHDVLFDTVVSVLTEENPYTIRYEANGAAAAASSGLSGTSGDVSHAGDVSNEKISYLEFSYPAAHLRVNTEQGTHLFERENYILTGWNTSADGSGQHIGLGSRVRVGRGEILTLYAEWALCNDESDFLYEKGANSVTITGFNGGNSGTPEAGGEQARPQTPPEVADTSDVIVIPSGCTLSELVLFDSVSEITDHAFAGCENLRTIRINACVPPVYSGSYYDTFPDKFDRLAALSNDAKIVLFSGSSTRFGYDSAYLDDAFPDYEVVNMGVFAYTNALPQLDLIRGQMKAGDILIHSPEFDAAGRQFCTTDAFDDKFFNMMDGQPVSSPSYNEYGDYIVYRPNAEDDAPIYDLPVNYTVGAFSKTAYIDPLNAVYDKFAADGIRVLFTYAPRNKSALSEESDSAALAALDAWLRESLHAEVISPIEDSLYPGRYLFGTDNHLSTDGVSIRSERIRRDLEEVLDDAK